MNLTKWKLWPQGKSKPLLMTSKKKSNQIANQSETMPNGRIKRERKRKRRRRKRWQPQQYVCLVIVNLSFIASVLHIFDIKATLKFVSRMYRRHCWDTTLGSILVPCCLWLRVLPLVQVFVPTNTSWVGNEDMEATHGDLQGPRNRQRLISTPWQ